LSETAVSGTVEYGNPGAQIVDLFPPRESSIFFRSILPSALKLKDRSFSVKYIPAWLPGMGFKRYALRVRKDVEEMENMLFDVAKKYMVSFPQNDMTFMGRLPHPSIEIRFYDLLGRTPP
jgi:hypothetical protein